METYIKYEAVSTKTHSLFKHWHLASVRQLHCIRGKELFVRGIVGALLRLTVGDAAPVAWREGGEGEHDDREARRGGDQRQQEEDPALEAAKLTDVVHDLVIVQTGLLGVSATHV